MVKQMLDLVAHTGGDSARPLHGRIDAWTTKPKFTGSKRREHPYDWAMPGNSSSVSFACFVQRGSSVIHPLLSQSWRDVGEV